MPQGLIMPLFMSYKYIKNVLMTSCFGHLYKQQVQHLYNKLALIQILRFKTALSNTCVRA